MFESVFILAWIAIGLLVMVTLEYRMPKAMDDLLGNSPFKALSAWVFWPLALLNILLIHWVKRRIQRRSELL